MTNFCNLLTDSFVRTLSASSSGPLSRAIHCVSYDGKSRTARLAKLLPGETGRIQGQGKKALTAVAVPKKPEASAKAKPSTASSTGASGEETGATGEEGASADGGGGKGASADSAGDAAGETPAGGAQDDDSGAQGGGSAGDGASPEATETPGGKDGVGSTTNGELMFVLFFMI